MTAIIHNLSRPNWRSVVLATLAFWLSASLLLDFIVMPTMYATGMMVEPGFATAGYSLFGLFNRVELVCAALVLTGVLALGTTQATFKQSSRWLLPLSVGLLGVVLVCTYDLAPAMSGLGMELNLFEPAVAPALMNQMHLEYWLLEGMKLVGTGLLLSRFSEAQQSPV